MTMVRGWCPDAWRPMAAGDGLLVRVRPRLGRLTQAQVLGLCAAATEHGNGLIDLTRRANLQLRGITEASWPKLVAVLLGLDLIDADPATETRRAIMIAPDWQPGDDTENIARALASRLHELPELPAKMGFVIDAGTAPLLIGEAGDFRVERGHHGGLVLRADGRSTGVGVAPGDAADALIELAHWFTASDGIAAGRMARHSAALPQWAVGDASPASPGCPLTLGSHPLGAVFGAVFGQIEAGRLAELTASATALRVTPWRLLIAEGANPEPDTANTLLHVDACPGKPLCPQASVETRDLARRLAPYIAGRLHVSGCAKGCARSLSSDTVLTGRDGRFDLALNARAGAHPIRTGLDPADVLAYFGAT